MLTVYSKSKCAGCESTKAYLTRLGIPFVVKSLDTDKDALAFMVAQSHKSVPQIYYGDKLFVFGGWPSLRKMTETDIKEHMELFRKEA